MRSIIVLLLILSGALAAAQEIPAGTVLPVRLNSALRSNRMRAGQAISARVMQNVPLPAGERLHSGAKVLGRVIQVQRARPGVPAELELRFDTIQTKGRNIPVTTNLRAMATMMDVLYADVPDTGPDRGTSPDDWVTEQIGGETVYRGGGPVMHGSHEVGKSVGDGVLVRVSENAKAGGCRGELVGDGHEQALWLFSSDACGLYDLPGLELVHAGRSDPKGEIRLRAKEGDIFVRSGSGLLLRVD